MSLLFRYGSNGTLALRAPVYGALLLVLTALLSGESRGADQCAFEPVSGDKKALFVKHLPKDCSRDERERLAVDATEILEAIKEGKGIDLAGVVVIGDLLLDQLPAQPLSQTDVPPRLRDLLRSRQVADLRVVRGPVMIKDSWVRGRITTNLKEGIVAIAGPVITTGTTFDRMLDLSHAAFLESVDFSDSILLQEAYFVRSVFIHGARFERTAFGTHTRFHRALFAGPVNFLRAGFSGLAEFLEVTFEMEAGLSRTYFKLGTGFSGSRFHQGVDFSEATFDREAYFLYTQFDGDAYFRRATFRATADFSEAEFKGIDDFSKAYFELAPTFTGAKRSGERSLGGLQNPQILQLVVAALLVFTLVFILVLRKL